MLTHWSFHIPIDQWVAEQSGTDGWVSVLSDAMQIGYDQSSFVGLKRGDVCPFTLTLERAVSECNREDLDLRNRPKALLWLGIKGWDFNSALLSVYFSSSLQHLLFSITEEYMKESVKTVRLKYLSETFSWLLGSSLTRRKYIEDTGPKQLLLVRREQPAFRHLFCALFSVNAGLGKVFSFTLCLCGS